jgi:dTDP-glucose pyrophosphorylase
MKDNWRSALVVSQATVEIAAEVLTNSSMRIVLVVDKHDRLLGTVTDGDIRRALMGGISMKTAVDEIMQKNPVTVDSGDDRKTVLQLMRQKDILQVPVLDESQRVVGLEVMQDFVYGAPRENPVLLMAGGFGKRLHPLTKGLPKPLLTVGDKPILETIVEQLSEAGFSQFFMAVHYKAELLRAHFGDGSNWGITIRYLEEEEPLGTAGALSLLSAEPIQKPVLVMNGDLLTRLDFNQLLDYHDAHDGVATICVREHEIRIPYGVVQAVGIRVEDITEKPVKKLFINAGIYVLDPDIVKGRSRVLAGDMPDLLRETIKTGEQVNMFPIHEYWLDIGRVEEYRQAQIDVTEFSS